MASNALRFLYWFTFIVLICALLVLWWLWHRPPSDVVADFQNRTSTVYIQKNFLGSGGVGTTLSDSSGMRIITDANLRGNRVWASLNLIYASGDTPDYGLFDQQMNRATANGLDPIVVIYGTPPSLGASACSMPSSVAKWAQLATGVVAHIDQAHAGLRYEIWNEPDAGAFCSSNQLQDYLTLYGTAVPKMRDAAPTARFGGPALASPGPNAQTWIPALLSGATAPYVDFLSFHLYITGTWLLPGMTWDQLYQQTINPTAGLSYYYVQFEKYVRAGSQPNPATTPIYIDEYNTNYSYSSNCCQNDVIFGPLWNTTAMVIWMNAVSDGASTIPGGLVYFMSSDANNFFCLIGAPSDNYADCRYPTQGQNNYAAYPSLLAYQLFAQAGYLNIEDGGNVAARPKVPQGLLATAFYTAHADDLVIVNPTSTAYSELRVKLQHPGMHSITPKLFLLSNNNLVSSPLRIAPALDGVTAKVDLPAYSTLAIQLTQQ